MINEFKGLWVMGWGLSALVGLYRCHGACVMWFIKGGRGRLAFPYRVTEPEKTCLGGSSGPDELVVWASKLFKEIILWVFPVWLRDVCSWVFPVWTERWLCVHGVAGFFLSLSLFLVVVFQRIFKKCKMVKMFGLQCCRELFKMWKLLHSLTAICYSVQIKIQVSITTKILNCCLPLYV